jgi:hypothetical protein
VYTLWVVAKDILIDLFVERLRTIFALIKLQGLQRVSPDVVSEVIPATECAVSDVTDDLSDGLESSIVLRVLVWIPLSHDYPSSVCVSRSSELKCSAASLSAWMI